MANACPKCTYFYVRCKCDEILLEAENKRLKKALEDLRTITLRKFSQAEMQCLLLQNIEQALK